MGAYGELLLQFDLVIKGGTVVSPGSRSGQLDVGIKGNRIAAVESSIPPEAAARVVDAGGLIVTPGLVDLHTHFFTTQRIGEFLLIRLRRGLV